MASSLWGPEEIESTVQVVGLTPGVGSKLPDQARFARGTRVALASSVSKHGLPSLPAVFVFAPEVAPEVAALGVERRRVHTGRLDFAGHLWLFGAAATDGIAIPLETADVDAIFCRVAELGLGESPTIYCDTNAEPDRAVAWYPLGLNEAERLYEGPIELTHVPSLDELFAVIDGVHRTKLLTTVNQNSDTSLWEEPSKHWPHDHAERRVQDALLGGLGGAFGPPFFVEQEKTTDSGRFDLGFRRSLGGAATQLHAILELKVTRSFTDGGTKKTPLDNERHVYKGVEQAWSYADDYGDEGGTPDAACLVFDLRTHDLHELPPKAVDRAGELGVVIRLWRCFPTAESYRTFKIPEAVA